MAKGHISPPIKRSLLQRGLTYLVSLGLVVLPILAMSKNYASFFREHKQLRSYTNPATPVYALGKLASIQLKQAQAPKTQIMHATDAVQVSNPTTRKPKLVVLVVGETARNNTMCNPYGECRDVGMLVGLDDYVKQLANQNTLNQDTLIVLHQMGNHGPAYFKRYDKQFEKFTPVCQSNEHGGFARQWHGLGVGCMLKVCPQKIQSASSRYKAIKKR